MTYSSLLKYFINKNMLKFLEHNHIQIIFHIPTTKPLVFSVVANIRCIIILFLFMVRNLKLCTANADLNAVAEEMTLAHFH